MRLNISKGFLDFSKEESQSLIISSNLFEGENKGDIRTPKDISPSNHFSHKKINRVTNPHFVNLWLYSPRGLKWK